MNNPHATLAPSTDTNGKSLVRTSSSISIEQKMSRFKKTNSASASTLLKHTRVNSNVSNNSTGIGNTGNSNNVMMKRSSGASSMVNLNQQSSNNFDNNNINN